MLIVGGIMRGVMGRFGKTAAAVSVLALAAGSAAACSSSGSSGGGSGSGSGGSGSLKDALKNIHATAQTGAYIDFGDTAQLAKLNGGTNQDASGPFAGLLGRGADNMSEYTRILPPLTGFDSSTATSAITVGKPPNSVEVLYGSFDPAAIGAKLAAWGYHKQDRGGGVTAWIFQDDHKIDPTKIDPNTGVGPGMMTGWLNVVWVSKTSVAYGRATSDLAAALPAQSHPLAKDAVVGQLADCLGSPLAAVVMTDAQEIQSSAVSAIAFGVTGTGTADMREEICVAAPDAAGAQSLAAGFTKAVDSGLDYKRNVQWSSLLSDPQTSVLGGSAHVVRLSAKPVASQAGNDLVFQLVEQNDFLTLLGLPEQLKNGGTVDPTDAGSGSDTASPSS